MSCLERAPGSDIIRFAFARPWPFKVRTQGDTANLERLALGARIGADKLQDLLEQYDELARHAAEYTGQASFRHYSVCCSRLLHCGLLWPFQASSNKQVVCMALKRLLRHSRPEDFDAIREVAELYLVLVASTSGVEQMFTKVLRGFSVWSRFAESHCHGVK